MDRASNHPWQPALEGDQAAAAVAAARDVAARLREPSRVEAAAAAVLGQTGFPRSAHWQPFAIAQGYAGLALMYGYLDACFPRDGWDRVGHIQLQLAVHGAEQSEYLPPGIFSGLSGLAFAALQLSRGGTRYGKMLASLDATLVPDAFALAVEMGQRRDGISVGDFDAISGLSGSGAYLLCRRAEAGPSGALRAVVNSLIDLTREEAGVPRWHTPGHMMWDEYLQANFPQGNLNCGLAHGIPGPLAFLALACMSGMEVEGLADAIDRVAGWLADNRCDDDWGENWPNAVALEKVELPDGPALRPAPAAQAPGGPGRAAWCYGGPGIARALWLAGEALDDSRYRKLAVKAMEAVYRRPVAERHVDSPTFCHGVAGLLQITLRFAHDTGEPIFIQAARDLAAQVLSRYEPDSLLGYRDLEPGDRLIDQPGLLDGAPGVALVLLAASTGVEPTWDRLFLLS